MDVHAAVYGRQSSERENKSEASTATQRARGVEEAERRNATKIELYEDLGISAFSGIERPDFERMLRDCRTGKVNMIVVYYISRLSRLDPLDAIPIVSELLNLGVTIVSVTEGEFRKGNLMDLIHLIMRLDAAHSESKNKSVAVSGAKRAARELGGFTGGRTPYGFKMVPATRYNAEGKPIVIQELHHNADEAKVIRDIWATIREHRNTVYAPTQTQTRHPGSLTGIAARMNAAKKVPTRGATTGKKQKDSVWDTVTITRILRDPRIAGFAVDLIYKAREDGRRSKNVESYRILRDPETTRPIQAYPPIIPPDEWYELQAWLDTRTPGAGLSRGTSLLSGLDILRCECGAHMSAHSSAKESNRSYRCGRRPGAIQPGQHAGECTVSQRVLDEYVARRIFALIQTAESDPETLDILWEATRRYGAALEAPERAGERAALVAERADAVAALDELYATRKAGGYRGARGVAMFVAEESEMLSRMEAAEERIRGLEANDTPALPIGEWLPEDPGADPIGEGSWWHSASIADRRAFVKLFIRRIVVRKAERRGIHASVERRVTIEWNSTARETD
jgi:DNA invertase Pin-like site-specific DNA recombinase